MKVLAIGLTASLLAVTTLLLQPTRPAAVAASRTLLELRGGSGALCFVSGTQNCPPSDDPSDCDEYECEEDDSGVQVCPKPHVDKQLVEDFSDVAHGRPGYRKFKELDDIFCTERQECEECEWWWRSWGYYCKEKASKPAYKTNKRTPTTPDSNSDPC